MEIAMAKDKRVYTPPPDWVHEILLDWSEQVRTRPRQTVTVTPGGRFPDNVAIGGSANGMETARGSATRRSGPPDKIILGYEVKGLTGTAARADGVMLRMAGVSPRCAWVLRAEYGLIEGLDPASNSTEKGKHLGSYLEGRAWSKDTYDDRRAVGRQLFAVGYLCAV